jgi:hypothetical protein
MRPRENCIIATKERPATSESEDDWEDDLPDGTSFFVALLAYEIAGN